MPRTHRGVCADEVLRREVELSKSREGSNPFARTKSHRFIPTVHPSTALQKPLQILPLRARRLDVIAMWLKKEGLLPVKKKRDIFS